MSLYVGVGWYRVIPGHLLNHDCVCCFPLGNCKTVVIIRRIMTMKVKPPVKKEDIYSSFDVEWSDGVLCIEAEHHWSVDPDPTVWTDLTYDEIDQMEWTEWGVEIHREFDYHPREDSDFDEHVACYISKFCDVPDMNEFNDGRSYEGDFPDPWLFTDDQEELVVKDGVPCSKEVYVDKETWSEDSGYESEWVYEPLFDVSSIQEFAHAHHFGLLEDSPDPVQQVIDVLEYNHPEAVSLEEYRNMSSSVNTEAKADFVTNSSNSNDSTESSVKTSD